MDGPKLLTKKVRAKMTGVKIKGDIDVADGELAVNDAQIVLTLTIEATRWTLRMMDFFNGSKPTKNTPNKFVDVTIAGQQYALDLDEDE
jgi:hypothetical protein